MGWSSVTASGTYDRAQVPEPNVSVIQNSGSSISAYQPSEHLEQQSSQPASSSSLPANETVKKKKSKMHQCEVCGKFFPRPSGLKTHMNTHNNLKPFSCGFEGCSRTFTVRSNAKRHLRTHGVETVSSRQTSSTPYSIGFDTPTIVPPTTMHETATTSYKLRWMPPSLSTRTNATSLVSVSDDESSDDEYGHGLGDQSKSLEGKELLH
ncbi:Zinc finger protein [Termitomyces sp. T112]|nr:Zinc finger protein [Termitomyces sp. T112]